MNIFNFPENRQQGITLVELMVAMAIGLVIAGLTASVFITTKQTFRHQQNLARLQENARFAVDTIAKSIRNAGYRGCGSVSIFANVVKNASSTWWLNLETPLSGYEGGVSTFPNWMTNVVTGTDAFITVGVDNSDDVAVIDHNPNAAQINTSIHSIKPGSILVITDCAHTTVFQMSGPTNNNNNATNVVHNTGNTITPGNCYKGFGASCGSTEKNYTYQPGATIMKLYSNAFFIAPSTSGNGANSLWTVSLDASNGASTTAATSTTELVEGVDNMQVEYGEDTDNDGVPNRFVTANTVTDWTRIVNARVSLLMSTLEDGIATGNQTYEYEGASVEANDRRVRRAYTSLVNLRNRTQ